MKVLRLSVLLSVLLLLVAGPAAADVRGIPASDGHPQATIEGTITSVNVPFASPGPIVTLLDGLVHFDAEKATVRYVNGQVAAPGSLAVGQRILALLDPLASPLEATTVVILSDRTGITLTGKVEAVDTAAGTLGVLGLTVKVTERTVFGGPRDGSGQKGLGDLAVGDLVLVDAKAEAEALVATKVLKLSPAPDPVMRIHGIVDKIGTESWTILGPADEVTVVKIGPDTKIVGEPKVGDAVEVLARRSSDGSLLAVLIAKAVPPPAVSTERYRGIVKEIQPAAWTIGPAVGLGPDRLFAVNERTRFLGEPKLGNEVDVLAQRQADGSWLALVIARTTLTDPGRIEVQLDGVVKEIQPGRVAGTWLVDDTKVVVSPITVVRGNPRVGDRVHVEGWKSPDGSVLAKLVAKL